MPKRKPPTKRATHQAAQLLAASRWAKTPPQKRTQLLSRAARARWQKTTAEERTAFARWVASQPRPGRRSPDRCPCGEMTRARALARRHKCAAPETAQP
jgi:hypothetical protein